MGATGLLDNSSLLLKWSVSAQVIAEMLQTSEDELPTSQAMTHHENTPTFKATFKKDKNAFIEVFLEAESILRSLFKKMPHSYCL